MKDFQIKVFEEIKRTKRQLYLEELKSFLAAVIFSANVACVVVLSVGFLWALNLIAAFVMIRHFKPTVKKQELLHIKIKTLRNVLKEQKVSPKKG